MNTKRILVALSSKQLDTTTVEFACKLANHENAQLTGVFLDSVEAWPLYMPAGHLASPMLPDVGTYVIPVIDENQPAQRKENAEIFAAICSRYNVPAELHKSEQLFEGEFIHLTHFADLLVINSGFSASGFKEDGPSDLVRSILASAKCPVIVSPETPAEIDELCFAYDGSASSIFAIKQFTYLMPRFRDKAVTILEVRKDSSQPSEDDQLMKQWLDGYFANVSFRITEGDAEDQLFTTLHGRNNVLLVIGAFGRGTLSNFFRHSTAEKILNAPTYPVFITHH